MTKNERNFVRKLNYTKDVVFSCCVDLFNIEQIIKYELVQRFHTRFLSVMLLCDDAFVEN